MDRQSVDMRRPRAVRRTMASLTSEYRRPKKRGDRLNERLMAHHYQSLKPFPFCPLGHVTAHIVSDAGPAAAAEIRAVTSLFT